MLLSTYFKLEMCFWLQTGNLQISFILFALLAFNKVFYGSPQTICSSAVSVLPAYLPIITVSADPHLHPYHQLCVIHTPLSRYHVVLTLILDKAK